MERKHLSFRTPAHFRAWLKKNHLKAEELHLRFYKKDAGKPSITWPESVAEALCFGWIDGIRRRIDDESYSIRFTPRRKNSKWSAINIRMIATLEAAGKMTEAGRTAFNARPNPHSEGYIASKKDGQLNEARLRAFKKNKVGWAFFAAQPRGYQRAAAWWVMQAKKEATKDARFAKLLESSVAGRRLH